MSDGSFTKNGGNNMSIQNSIQHPDVFYPYSPAWFNGYNQYNLWSMDNTTIGYNDNPVVKTVYDPCPAGFKMPASNAFTGFSKTGDYANPSDFNISGAWDNGWNFNNKLSSPDATVYFPASGCRHYLNGPLDDFGDKGYYWSAGPYNEFYGCILEFNSGRINPRDRYGDRPGGFSVRPVAE